MMILHTCPHCQNSAFYTGALSDAVNCRSCGGAFTLTRFNRVDKTRLVRLAEVAKLKAENLRLSRGVLYSGGALVLALLTWIGLSVFGALPDEARIINRPFVRTDDKEDLARAVGLVAVGDRNIAGDVHFVDFYTACAVTTDGFLLTSKEVAKQTVVRSVWVFVGNKRYDARLVDADSVGDFALIKIAGDVPVRFHIGRPENLDRLNVEVTAVGYEQQIDTPPIDWSLSTTRGTVSRTYADNAGTDWIDHTSAMVNAGQGGPVILGDYIIALNVDSSMGITRAVSILPYREKILQWIKDWDGQAKPQDTEGPKLPESPLDRT